MLVVIIQSRMTRGQPIHSDGEKIYNRITDRAEIGPGNINNLKFQTESQRRFALIRNI